MRYPATLLCDFYKVSHKDQYPEGTEVIYSTWTPRSNRYIPRIKKVTAFGFQSFIKEYLIRYFDEIFFKRPLQDVIKEYVRLIKFTLGVENPDYSHIETLHRLGYLPVRIKAVKEGSLIPMRVPILTIENTDSRFFWLTNYLETLLSSELWQPTTSASIATEYYRIGAKFADETVGNRDHIPFQFHDFSFRGMEGLHAAAASGAGHLLPFVGTDTIPSILYHEKYYNANIETELVGTSIPATEHSVMCANSDADTRDEYDNFKRLITEVYPNGFVSIVSDTYDFWAVIGDIIPRLKQEILNRDGKVVIRPDSGDPVDILCGRQIPDLTNEVNTFKDAKDYMYDELMDKLREETPHGKHGDTEVYGEFKFQGKYYEIELEVEYNRHDKQYYYIEEHRLVKCVEFTPALSTLGLIEALWNIFGGIVNELGYKLLDPHIGAIYGDSITLERAEQIFERLKAKGFASSNIVLGIGSYTYQYNTRDNFGFAVKATYSKVNGEEKALFKDPKTDNGTKRSQRGRVVVFKDEDGEIKYADNLGIRSENVMKDINLLQTIFEDGKLLNEQSLADIRKELFTNL
jgi:nicotinamide phosphoribosyltransferase